MTNENPQQQHNDNVFTEEGNHPDVLVVRLDCMSQDVRSVFILATRKRDMLMKPGRAILKFAGQGEQS